MPSRSARLGFGFASAFALSVAVADPTQLSAEALDQAVAGAESVASETESAHPTVIVADDAQIDLHLRRGVALTDQTQRNLTALNAINSAHADVANGINVLQAGALIASQVNDIEQTEQHLGRAAVIERRGVNRTTTSEQHNRVDAQSFLTSYNERTLRTRSHRSIVDTYNAEVPGYFPLQNLSLTVGTPDLAPVYVPGFGFSVRDETTGIGLSAGIGPFYFEPPQIVLGTVALSGNDIVFRGGFVDLGALDLGSAYLSGCAGELCIGFSVDLPTIDGPRIEFDNEYRIANGNPFKDIRINAGAGVSAAGSGHLRVDLGHVTVTAALSLDLPDLTTSFEFDVLGQTVSSGEFGISLPTISASVDLIDADIGVAYDATFNGVLCLSIVTTTCQGSSHAEVNEAIHVEITHSNTSAAQSASASNTVIGTESIVIGARMSGAEADLIAMSEGNALIDTESVVHLDAQAQRGMKVVNAVNATGAMVGNALNAGAQVPAATASGSLAQSNVFTQYQTRPRAR